MSNSNDVGTPAIVGFMAWAVAVAAFALAAFALARANHPSEHLGHKTGASYGCKLVKR